MMKSPRLLTVAEVFASGLEVKLDSNEIGGEQVLRICSYCVSNAKPCAVYSVKTEGGLACPSTNPTAPATGKSSPPSILTLPLVVVHY